MEQQLQVKLYLQFLTEANEDTIRDADSLFAKIQDEIKTMFPERKILNLNLKKDIIYG